MSSNMRIQILFLISILPVIRCQMGAEFNKQLETDLLKNYNGRHRPVKKEETTVQVSVYMSISHVEKVDEHEQTMLVHGHLWSTWVDEYLKWSPSEYNKTEKIYIDSWKLWQPALALYNSARGNGWHLYMNGLPASVTSNGKVFASGSFSFHVTCKFDFSEWPYDEQECPIVISDWVYDLSRVNLSDPQDSGLWSKPAVRLNYDPTKQDEKKHVAGWEVMDTWRRHCYWGQHGCKEETPEGPPEQYWSLLEFGVKLKRHAPYFGLTVIMPTIITCLLTLASFWVDTNPLTITLLIFNILLQGLFGWDLIRELPPGSGNVPKIVTLYGFNLMLTTFSFVLHVLIDYFLTILPADMVLPIGIGSLPEKLKINPLFQVKGLSFDPQLLLSGADAEDPQEYNSPLASIHSSDALQTEDETIIQIDENQGNSAAPSLPMADLPEEEGSSSSPKPDATGSPALSKMQLQMYTIRRFVFCFYVIVYFITLIYFFI